MDPSERQGSLASTGRGDRTILGRRRSPAASDTDAVPLATHQVEVWTTPNGDAIHIARVANGDDLAAALRALGLAPARPALAIVGGAGALSEGDLDRLRPLFIEGLAPLAEARGVVVVDGGTDAGVMRLMGEARAAISGTFPLVGVAPAAKVTIPGKTKATASALLEPHHTHIVLVPAKSWEDAVPWFTLVVDELAGGEPSLTVLVDGGDVSWLDVVASIEASRPVLAVAGTGRLADELASTLAGETSNARADALRASGRMLAVDFADGPAAVAAAVARALDASQVSPDL